MARRKPNPSVSLCMILKDNEARVRRALSSANGLYDELIVVMDPRSTDRTEEYVREFGAKVYHQEWLGFAEQRNQSIRHARGDWVMILDGDEEIVNVGNIKHVLAAAWQNKLDAIFCQVQTVTAQGEVHEVDMQPRFFDRSRIRYKFPVHNQATGWRSDKVILSDFSLRAYYDGDMETRCERAERPLLDMLESATVGSAEWKHAHYFLARTYAMVGRLHEARVHAEMLLETAGAEVGFSSCWDVLLRCIAATEPAETQGKALREAIDKAMAQHPGLLDVKHWNLVLAVFDFLRTANNMGPYSMVPQRTGRWVMPLLKCARSFGVQVLFDGAPPDAPEQRKNGKPPLQLVKP